MGRVVPMAKKKAAAPKVDPSTPWGILGFLTERDMLLDDLKQLSERIKSPNTTATAVAALSKRKHEVFEQIKAMDSDASDPDSILDDSDDEAWDGTR